MSTMVRSRVRSTITLRPCNDGDREFLYSLYASSREKEMNLLADWSTAQKEAFLREQFRLQHHHYHTHYPNAQYDIVEREGKAIGRLYVER